MVDTVEVVLEEVALELVPETGVARIQVTGEGRPPALLEDEPVQGFDVAVRLWPARADVRQASAERGDRALEALAAKLVAVVAEDALEAPASLLQIPCHPACELRGGEG